MFQGTTQIAAGTLSGSNEEINVLVSAAGLAAPITNITVYVHGWGVTGGTTPFKLNTWLLGNTSAGNMAVTGTSGTIGLTFTGLTAGTRYLGSVAYGGTTGLPNPTIINVNP